MCQTGQTHLPTQVFPYKLNHRLPRLLLRRGKRSMMERRLVGERGMDSWIGMDSVGEVREDRRRMLDGLRRKRDGECEEFMMKERERDRILTSECQVTTRYKCLRTNVCTWLCSCQERDKKMSNGGPIVV